MLRTRPPRSARSTRAPVRLACIRHAASVPPEPGSNSPSRITPHKAPDSLSASRGLISSHQPIVSHDRPTGRLTRTTPQLSRCPASRQPGHSRSTPSLQYSEERAILSRPGFRFRCRAFARGESRYYSGRRSLSRVPLTTPRPLRPPPLQRASECRERGTRFADWRLPYRTDAAPRSHRPV